MREAEILATLVAFPTVTDGPNGDLIDWVSAHLADAGFAVTRIAASAPGRSGLLAKLGAGEGGLLLSAHSDVVPPGAGWSTDPFTLTERGGRLQGRGATDMKGFLACALALAERLKNSPPAAPVSLALSWDEEIGCRGIAEMIGQVVPVLGRPELVVVGEPTGMRLCTGHKGKNAYLATATGEAAHSSRAPYHRNALHGAAELVLALRDAQARLLADGARDDAYDPPVSTIHAGTLHGGTALNIVPDRAEVAFEIRHLAAETPEALLATIPLPEGVEVAPLGAYPGLAADASAPAIKRLAGMLDDPAPITVSYGTEAGFFAAEGLNTVVCGPGDMADAHRADESISAADLARCSVLLARLAGAG
ncbi:acetylornithine deacetylase [Pseudoroseicyclus tamaricis]|uniref:Acetylornithine deacetylase n=1 Tax=Pseudoroseicyclus tamaricis TaxID=2705421 RepID=A0A6B2JVS1_9RHOB|nr:acetylornithine deacetylase [Pseudoroseicyclus tamaricis]NDV00749.1 acetylornithine deacetylase [Pseudoroseicyclus tamaricis]